MVFDAKAWIEQRNAAVGGHEKPFKSKKFEPQRPWAPPPVTIDGETYIFEPFPSVRGIIRPGPNRPLVKIDAT